TWRTPGMRWPPYFWAFPCLPACRNQSAHANETWRMKCMSRTIGRRCPILQSMPAFDGKYSPPDGRARIMTGIQSLSRYRGDGGMAAWMVGTARHKVQDYYRRALRSAELSEDSDCSAGELPRIEETVFQRQRDDRIHAVLTELPEIYRFVLLWRYWEEQSVAE